MKLMRLGLVSLAFTAACGDSSADRQRKLGVWDERRLCERTLVETSRMEQRLGDLIKWKRTHPEETNSTGRHSASVFPTKRGVSAMSPLMLYCTADDDGEAIQRTLTELERLSPDCYDLAVDEVALHGALVRLVALVKRGLESRTNQKKPRLVQRQRLCERALRELEQAALAANDPDKPHPGRLTGDASGRLRPIVDFCVRRQDANQASLHHSLLTDSANLCPPWLRGSSLPEFGASIERERKHLTALIELMRRASNTTL